VYAHSLPNEKEVASLLVFFHLKEWDPSIVWTSGFVAATAAPPAPAGSGPAIANPAMNIPGT
jgi:hypothetical protein